MKAKQLMKLVLPMFMMLSIATSLKAQELQGRYFGKVEYDGSKREVAILLNAIESEPGNYYGVVYEYLNAYDSKFILDFLMPGKTRPITKKKNGYLQELLQWVQIYKFSPTEDFAGKIYKMQRLSVVNGEIVVKKQADAGKLTLSDEGNEDNRLEDAKLTMKIKNKDVVLKFTKTKRFPLSSTWENKYTPGPYNPGYKQADIQVLELAADYNRATNTETAKFNVSKLKNRDLVVKGNFTVKQAKKGMFTFTAKNLKETTGAALVQDKIGVFVDVFDAKPVMKTVELILIDPANDNNSQMYFEQFGNEDVNQLKKK